MNDIDGTKRSVQSLATRLEEWSAQEGQDPASAEYKRCCGPIPAHRPD